MIKTVLAIGSKQNRSQYGAWIPPTREITRKLDFLGAGPRSKAHYLRFTPIRYYERIGLIPSIERASNGHRRYSADDVGWIEFLKCLRSTGMPISDMQRYVELQQKGDLTFGDRLALLEAHRCRIKARIEELDSFLERIEGKIAYYQSMEAQGN